MKEIEYCTCEDVKGTHSIVAEFGYQDMCSECNKPIEDGFHYYDEPDITYDHNA